MNSNRELAPTDIKLGSQGIDHFAIQRIEFLSSIEYICASTSIRLEEDWLGWMG